MLELKKKIEFTKDDFDSDGNIKTSSMMFHFQEVAEEHANQLDLGYDRLIKNNWIWVLSKLKFKIYGTLEAGCEYLMRTYPRKKKGVTFFRDYYIYDNEDNLMAAGMSHWCIINFETRRLEKTELDFDGEYIDRKAFEEGIEKIKYSELSKTGSHIVTEEDLDINQHVNNCRYADIVTEATGISGIKSFIMNFSKEARLGDVIDIYTESMEEDTVVVGKVGDTVIFQSRIR